MHIFPWHIFQLLAGRLFPIQAILDPLHHVASRYRLVLSPILRRRPPVEPSWTGDDSYGDVPHA